MISLRTAGVVTAVVLSASTGAAQTVSAPTRSPDFKVEVVGLIAADFTARVTAYYDLRRSLEEGLPPLTITERAAAITEAEQALARRIREAREHAREGDIFTPAISEEFRRVLGLEIDGPTWAAIMEDNPGEFSRRINRDYPDEKPRSTVPANILAILPQLPDDVQYRFASTDLVLYDTRANLILDRIPDAIRCNGCVP